MSRPTAADQPIPELAEPSLERMLELPDAIWDCEGCEGEDTMRWRRSSLNRFGADDVLLKCIRCQHARTHGIEVPQEQIEDELQARKEKYGSRIIDLADHTDSHDADELLEALGYVNL